jgi:hypothetical protein
MPSCPMFHIYFSKYIFLFSVSDIAIVADLWNLLLLLLLPYRGLLFGFTLSFLISSL